jgi:hypothetical protein
MTTIDTAGPFVDCVPLFYQTDFIDTDTLQKLLGVEVGEQVREWLLANKPQLVNILFF